MDTNEPRIGETFSTIEPNNEEPEENTKNEVEPPTVVCILDGHNIGIRFMGTAFPMPFLFTVAKVLERIATQAMDAHDYAVAQQAEQNSRIFSGVRDHLKRERKQ